VNKTTIFGILLLGCAPACGGEITRHALPDNSTFPIARAVEVSADTTLIYHSGTVPAPADPDAEPGSAEFWGDTETQALSVFARLEQSFEDLGLGFGDVVKMTAFLVGDPAKGGRMDFDGFMRAYSKYFGTEEQPNLPARSTVQVAALGGEGMLVEIEVVLARPQ
jgi:enamine deaminase RidA (YjgF/YER057c/UK114 family)